MNVILTGRPHRKVLHGFAHRGKRTRLYTIWRGMRQRCFDENYALYHCYGGKGVTICASWLENFENFRAWAMNNGYADSLTIDRINSNGNYEPSNCRWVTRKENSRNTSLKVMKDDGAVYQNVFEAAEANNVSVTGIRNVCLGYRSSIFGMKFKWLYV